MHLLISTPTRMLFSCRRNDSYELFSCAVVLAAKRAKQRVVSGLTIHHIIHVYRSMTWIGNDRRSPSVINEGELVNWTVKDYVEWLINAEFWKFRRLQGWKFSRNSQEEAPTLTSVMRIVEEFHGKSTCLDDWIDLIIISAIVCSGNHPFSKEFLKCPIIDMISSCVMSREPIPVLYLNGTRLLISLCWRKKTRSELGCGTEGRTM